VSQRALREQVEEAVDAAFEARQVPLLRTLVEQPSCTREREDVEACAAILDEAAANIELDVRRAEDPSGRFAAHRVYSTAAAAREDVEALLLVGHVDTVFPRALGFFGMTREGDVARGPGVLDMKSGLTSVLGALDAVRTAAPEAFARLRVRFVCVTDEEVGSPSSAPLFRELARHAEAALVFEAGRSGDRIVTRRKGGGVFTVEAHGRAAHAGNRHEEGLSAVHGLALLVPELEALTDYARGVTLNVGIFEGGTAKNTVPEYARCELDARFVRAEDGPWLEQTLAGLVRGATGTPRLPEKLRALRFACSGGVTRPPMESTEASTRLRLAYERHAAQAGLGLGEAPLQGGGSDANLLAAAGVPCIDGLGPYGQHFHERQEWCSLESLRRRTRALATFLLERAARPPAHAEPGSRLQER
jgi:glutamate carboxypeptidase